MGDRVGIFGGTFDPVHNGHLAVSRSFLESGYIDELWVVPSPDPPHKTGEKLTDFEARKRMLEAAFAGFKRVRISDIENRLPRPSYTIHTIEYLKERHPGTTFYLCLGEDSLAELDTWHHPDRILEECELLVVSRPVSDAGEMKDKIGKRVHFVEHEPVAISSTELRERLREGKEVAEYLPDSVMKIIQKENHYHSIE